METTLVARDVEWNDTVRDKRHRHTVARSATSLSSARNVALAGECRARRPLRAGGGAAAAQSQSDAVAVHSARTNASVGGRAYLRLRLRLEAISVIAGAHARRHFQVPKRRRTPPRVLPPGGDLIDNPHVKPCGSQGGVLPLRSIH
jgi:hypothetical protein